MENPAISIIVPVYNIERYLEQCLKSIEAQTFTDWECIVVNDGSTDGSLCILKDFAARDTRFKLIDKENGGLSSARNAGLKIAKGSYIGFVDSDDWIEPGMYETLYNAITEHRADIAQVGYWREYTSRRTVKVSKGMVQVIDGATALRKMGFDKIQNYVWNKLHRREIITSEFPVGRNFEDIVVYGEWMKNVKKMVIVPEPFYHYRMRKGSLIRADAAKNRYDYFHSCIDRMNTMKDYIINPHDRNLRNAYLNKVAVTAGKAIAREEKDRIMRDKAILKISEEVKAYPLPSVKTMGNIKTWWRSKMLRNHPKFFASLMRGVYILDLDSKHRKEILFD